MATVEQSVLAFTGQQNHNSRGNPAISKQAWLRYLDQSGLLDALKNTQLTVAGISKFSSDQIPKKIYQTNLKSSDAIGIEPTQFALDISSERTAKLLPKASSMNLPVNSMLMQAPDELVLVSDVVSYQKDLAVLNHEEVILAKATGGDRPNHQEWSLRNMAVLQAEHGVELWIRDVEMTGHVKLQQLLKGLREHMGMLGASLVKVVVNGKEIFSEQASVNQQTI